MRTPVAPEPADSNRDPYRGVVFFLLTAAVVGTAGAVAGGAFLSNSVLLDVGVTLGLSAGVLVGVSLAQATRVRLRRTGEAAVSPPVQLGQPARSQDSAEPSKPVPSVPAMALAGRVFAVRILLRSVAARRATSSRRLALRSASAQRVWLSGHARAGPRTGVPLPANSP